MRMLRTQLKENGYVRMGREGEETYRQAEKAREEGGAGERITQSMVLVSSCPFGISSGWRGWLLWFGCDERHFCAVSSGYKHRLLALRARKQTRQPVRHMWETPRLMHTWYQVYVTPYSQQGSKRSTHTE